MNILLQFLLLFLFLTTSFAQTTSFFDYKVKNIVGDSVDLSVFKGKKIMVVNTASACGYTSQYAELQQLYDQYKNIGFEVIAFPSNDFNQEQGSDEDILGFCQSTYHVTFPLMSKVKVVGTDAVPVFKWLTQKSLNGQKDIPIQWNFYKFLINEDGTLYDFIATAGSPLAPKVTQWLDQGTPVPEQLARLDVFNVYPSPATTEFTIDLAVQNPTFIRLSLMTASGQQIDCLYEGMLEKELTTTYFTDKLKAGFYILMLDIEGVKHSKQFRVDK